MVVADVFNEEQAGEEKTGNKAKLTTCNFFDTHKTNAHNFIYNEQDRRLKFYTIIYCPTLNFGAF